jgi:hypothetical protein
MSEFSHRGLPFNMPQSSWSYAFVIPRLVSPSYANFFGMTLLIEKHIKRPSAHGGCLSAGSSRQRMSSPGRVLQRGAQLCQTPFAHLRKILDGTQTWPISLLIPQHGQLRRQRQNTGIQVQLSNPEGSPNKTWNPHNYERGH